MKTLEKNLILEIKQNYSSGYSGRIYGKYSPSFITTNEDVFGTFQAINPKGKSVLCVCGSGLHPIYAYMMGAEFVAVYDISNCAEYIMRLNIAEIKKLQYWQYEKFTNAIFKRLTVPHNKTFRMVRESLDDGAKFFFDTMKDEKFICDDSFNEPNLPKRHEFLKMKQTTPDIIKFLQTDICDLHTKLDRKYDIIHLSNIFGYMYDFAKKSATVKNLAEFLNDEGTMIVQYAYGNKSRADKTVEKLGAALPQQKFETIALTGGISPQYMAIMHKSKPKE
jgi:predicted nicotinamide N-methyase